MNALISVIVPVYNGDKYLAEALASVFAQAYAPLQVIVIDDGSTDTSAAVAKQFDRVELISQPNGGISVARNRGIEHAQGEFLALLDADDLWLADKLLKQTSALAADPGLDMVFGQVREFISPELPPEIANRLPCEPEPRPGLIPSALLVRRTSFDRVGAFDPQWKVGEFANWILRANEAGLRYAMLPTLVAKRRVHQSNHGIRERQGFQNYARMIKASLDRRRAAGKE